MMSPDKKKFPGGRAARWLVAAAFLAAVVFSGLLTGLLNKAGLIFLLLGAVAAILTGFSRREIFDAFRHAAGRSAPPTDLERSAYFWEAAARDFWIVGVLGSVLNFILVMGQGSESIAVTSARMIGSLLVTLYGLALAVVCLIPAVKLSVKAGRRAFDSGPRPVEKQSILFERTTGYVLFAAVLGLTVYSLMKGSPQNGPLPASSVLFHGPAALVIVGGTIAISLFLGPGIGAKALTFGFGMTGLFALLLGLIQALFGFVHTEVKEIAYAVSFIISGSMYVLLGLVLIAAPLEDRELMDGRRARPSRLSRTFWRMVPLVVFLFLILMFLMVVTPMPAKKLG
jgi:hypothetical protein